MYAERRNLTPEEGRILVITLEHVVETHMTANQFLEAGQLHNILEQIKIRVEDVSSRV